MKSIVGIEKSEYIYNNDLYEYKDHMKVREKLGMDREIIIMGEPLFVKIYNYEYSKGTVENFVEDIIVKDFLNGDDLLFHYDFIKIKNTIYVYSIKKGLIVENIGIGAKSLSVVPIQFKIIDLINKKLKKYRNFISIAKIRDMYYLTNVEDGSIINGLVSEKLDILLIEIGKYIKINKEIIFDTCIKVNDKNISGELKEIHYLKIGEVINEKLFKKQKFYTKKIC